MGLGLLGLLAVVRRWLSGSSAAGVAPAARPLERDKRLR